MATVQEVLDSIANEVAQIDARTDTDPMRISPQRTVLIHIDDARTLLEWAKRMDGEYQRWWDACLRADKYADAQTDFTIGVQAKQLETLRAKLNAIPVDTLINMLRPDGAVDDDADKIE